MGAGPRNRLIAAAFLGMVKNRDQAVLVGASPFVFVHRKAIIDLAAEPRIAAIYSLQVYVEPGGLMSYGVNVPEMQQRAAVYVDKILKGAKLPTCQSSSPRSSTS